VSLISQTKYRYLFVFGCVLFSGIQCVHSSSTRLKGTIPVQQFECAAASQLEGRRLQLTWAVGILFLLLLLKTRNAFTYSRIRTVLLCHSLWSSVKLLLPNLDFYVPDWGERRCWQWENATGSAPRIWNTFQTNFCFLRSFRSLGQ
jgi:hypothetical protein